MASHKNVIPMSPKAGDLIPKKRKDHIAFKKSWTAKMVKAPSTAPSFPSRLVQTIQPDTAINKYNIVQTGANIQFGGLKTGLANAGYQSIRDWATEKDPANWIAPAAAMNANKLKGVFNFCILFRRSRSLWILYYKKALLPNLAEKSMRRLSFFSLSDLPLSGRSKT